MIDADVDAFRSFNRFHTRIAGALNEHILASAHTLPQARVLYEVANAPSGAPRTAKDLAEALGVDPGYLSRVIAGLEAEGLIRRAQAAGDARRLELSLTEAGRAAFAGLDAASAREVAALLAPLPARARRELTGAMARIRRLLGDSAAGDGFTLRDPEPGDIGWIVHRQARLYAEEYGWDWTFEAMVAEIAGRFIAEFRPGLERCRVAEREGGVVGSAFVVRKDEETAKLRMLYVDEAARGLGLGRRLVDECLDFARAAGYRRIELGTHDILVSARRIYAAAGFRLIETEAHRSFGKDLVAEVWARDL